MAITVGGDRAREVAARRTPLSTTLQPISSDQDEVRAYIAKISPGMMAYVEHPEVGPILKQATDQGWDSARLKATLQGTRWWRQTTDSQRQFDADEAMDPATTANKIQRQAALLAKQARTYGINVNQNQLNSLARDVLRNGLTSQEATDILINYSDGKLASATGGKIGGAAFRIRRAFAEYGLPVSEETIADLSRKWALNELDPDALESMIVAQAKARYPNMASLLDQGVTPKQYFAPVKETVARELEMNPESIDIFDPKYSQVLNMPLWEAQQWARSQPAWRQTSGANDKANSLVQMIAKTFGRIA